MFKCDYSKLRLSFNEFHKMEAEDLPEYGEYCLLELKDGRYTGGEWHPKEYKKKSTDGKFIRGTADAVDSAEVARWHSLDRYDLTDCLEDGEINYIHNGPRSEDIPYAVFKDFQSLKDGNLPKHEQFCLLILQNGGLGAGRWDQWPGEKDGTFVYAPALGCHSMEEVWAWTPLSSDDIFDREEEAERERKHEEELNKNPSADPEKFKYGTDIEVYYEKALEKLRKEYPWATLTQMKKKTPYVIAPRHGKYVFGRDNGTFMGSRIIDEWKEGSTADEFIDFLTEYTKDAVRDSNPDVKFKLGMDIEVYLHQAFEHVRKEYRWIDEKKLRKACRYSIIQVGGDWEFVRWYNGSKDPYVYNCDSSERFIELVEHDYQDEALRENPAVSEYAVPFKGVEMHGWHLEHYIFYKLCSGDYKVSVQAGDRVTGGTREFFITPYCFEAKTYEEFLDRYLKIVPGWSFGLYKEDLLPDRKLKEFLGYH